MNVGAGPSPAASGNLASRAPSIVSEPVEGTGSCSPPSSVTFSIAHRRSGTCPTALCTAAMPAVGTPGFSQTRCRRFPEPSRRRRDGPLGGDRRPSSFRPLSADMKAAFRAPSVVTQPVTKNSVTPAVFWALRLARVWEGVSEAEAAGRPQGLHVGREREERKPGGHGGRGRERETEGEGDRGRRREGEGETEGGRDGGREREGERYD